MGEKKNVEREGKSKKKNVKEKEKRREEEKEKQSQTKVWNLDFWYGNYFEVWIYGIIRLGLVHSLSPKARVLLEFHSNLGFHENRVGKTPYGTR